MKKRILVLINDSVGLYNFRKELLQEFLKMNAEVYISVPNGERIDELIKFGCRICEYSNRPQRDQSKDRCELMFFYKKLIKKLHPDLVITYTIKPNIYGGLMCRMLRVPYAVNITGLGTAISERKCSEKNW